MNLYDNRHVIHSFSNVKSIQIETIDYCNRKCTFCPNSHRKQSKDSRMSFDTLDRILNDLKALNYDGRIHPYLNGEPLMDDRLPDIIARIRDQFPNNVIFIATNGDKLTQKKLKELFSAGLSTVNISDYDEKDKFRQFKGWPNVGITKKSEVSWWYNRGGNIDVECPNPSSFCEWVMQKVYINWKGQVILCCSDFDSKVVFGDVNLDNLQDIYLSPHYKVYRIAHFLKRGEVMPLCRDCNRIVHRGEDD